MDEQPIQQQDSFLEFEPDFIDRLSFRFPKLRAALNAEQYRVHQAALEWSLDAPITIQDEQDILSRREWADRFDPYAHQIRNLITFCRRAPVALLADDVGLGKTISAGLIMSELMVRRKVDRVLVIAPKLLLPQWQEELGVKFGIAATTASGAELRSAIMRGMPVVVTTYHSARNYLPDIKVGNFDMIILDEAHKLRNLHGTYNPPQFATKIKSALADRWFKYVLMLTATPIQNRLWDLYSLIDLLTAARGVANPLGAPELFKAEYIEDKQGVKIKRGMRERFRRHLGSSIVRTRRADAKLLFPERRVEKHTVHASDCETELMHIVGELFSSGSRKVNGLAQSSIGQALMSSPEALLDQLRRMDNNNTIPSGYVDDVEEAVASSDGSGKLKGLLQLVRELREKRPKDWRVVVFTSRKVTQRVIGEALEEAGVPVGYIQGGKATQNERSIRQFWDDPPGVRVIVSTDAGAEGVNLQVANVLVNYDLPWNPMVLEQRIGRIQRLASSHAEVIILNLVLRGSVEEKVVQRLSAKLQAVSESLGDIEAILESMGSGDSDKDSMESKIRQLVVQSLKGIDSEKATSKALKSIEDAKQLFEEEKKTVESTLGDLRNMHRDGPTVPEITPVEPSIKPRDFVLRALKADGATVRILDGDILNISLPGQNPFKVTFKDRSWDPSQSLGRFGSAAPRLYLPGKRDFERLSQSWSEKACAFVVDRSTVHDDAIESVLGDWLQDIEGAELVDFEIVGRKFLFRGELVCRASIANEVDRLEKLVSVELGKEHPVEIEPPSEDEEPSRATVYEEDMSDQLVEQVGHAVANEQDLAKFASFYDDRLEEEFPNAENKAGEKRLEERFLPSMAAESVGVSAVRTAILSIESQVKIDGHGPIKVAFKLVPQLGHIQILESDPLVDCPSLGRKVPEQAVQQCAVTGELAPVWLLKHCAVSGELASQDAMISCEVTGDLVMPEYAGECAVTGKVVRKDLLVSSELGTGKALQDQLMLCEFTGARLLPDESSISDISGKRYRSDERLESALSARAGHRSEFVSSIDPTGMLAEDEVTKSDFSGEWCATDRLKPSEINPERQGLASEGTHCAVSGKWMLLDEAVKSDCSGTSVAPGELKSCEFTQSLVLPDELHISAISGKKYRSDQRAISVISKRSGHLSEFVDSIAPGGLIALDEASKSDVSREWCSTDKLIHSEVHPDRRGLKSEGLRCPISQKWLLIDEIERSELSNTAVAPGVLEVCEFTKSKVLPDELRISQVSGAKYRIDQERASVTTSLEGHESEFVDSDDPSGYIERDTAVQSSVSGKWGLKSRMVHSEMEMSRAGLPSEGVLCQATGRQLLEDEVAVSMVSGMTVGTDLLIESAISQRTGMKDEMVKCEQSGIYLFPDEAAKCEVSGKLVDQRLLERSDISGRGALSIMMLKCPVTGKRMLPAEAVRCSVTGQMVSEDCTAKCRVTDRIAIKDRLKSCGAGEDRLYIDDEITRKTTQERTGLNEIVTRSHWTGREALSIDTVECALSSLRAEIVRMNNQGELSSVRDLMNGAPGRTASVISQQKLQELKRALGVKLVSGESIKSPSNDFRVICLKSKTGILGLSFEFIMVIQETEEEQIRFTRIGKRTNGQWIASN